uniref:Chemokine interleukin-8-like domain-containing protein n=1 Tax=Sinocyclocheilus anshuiensis TaxID=1608454 RepID=A0A671QD41_9TELE
FTTARRLLLLLLLLLSFKNIGDGRPVPCCLTVSRTNIRAEYIVRYTMQDQPLCPIRAVRFHTKKNKVICSDPNNNWAKNAMRINNDQNIWTGDRDQQNNHTTNFSVQRQPRIFSEYCDM